MNSLEPRFTAGLHPAIFDQRNIMQKAFGSWMRHPTDQERARILFEAMNKYELSVRLLSVIPEGTPSDSIKD